MHERVKQIAPVSPVIESPSDASAGPLDARQLDAYVAERLPFSSVYEWFFFGFSGHLVVV